MSKYIYKKGHRDVKRGTHLPLIQNITMHSNTEKHRLQKEKIIKQQGANNSQLLQPAS